MSRNTPRTVEHSLGERVDGTALYITYMTVDGVKIRYMPVTISYKHITM